MSESALCPTCEEAFDSRAGMRRHHALAHGESLVEDTATCDNCGVEFEVSAGATGTYCSRACAGEARRDRVELTCAYCGSTFRVPRSDEDRQYCSTECQGRAYETSERRECAMCGRSFSARPSRDDDHCCRACSAEGRTDRPRPDDVDALLWLLYVYEDHSLVQTYRRQRARLGATDCLTQDAVRDRLREQGVFDPAGQGRRALAELDPDAVRDETTPEGDDAWRDLYEEGST